MAEIYQLPDNQGNNGGFGNIPFSIPIGGFGMGCMPYECIAQRLIHRTSLHYHSNTFESCA